METSRHDCTGEDLRLYYGTFAQRALLIFRVAELMEYCGGVLGEARWGTLDLTGRCREFRGEIENLDGPDPWLFHVSQHSGGDVRATQKCREKFYRER